MPPKHYAPSATTNRGGGGGVPLRGQQTLDRWAPPAPSDRVTETITPSIVWRRCAPHNKDEELQTVLYYKQRAMQPFRDAVAEGLEVTSVEASLVCPLSRSRIRVPARGADCSHLECFDLSTFLERAAQDKPRRDPSADCPFPHCRSKPTASSLEIDWWLYSVLNEASFADVNKVLITSEGVVVRAPDRNEALNAIEVDGLSQLSSTQFYAMVKTEPGLSESPADRRSSSATGQLSANSDQVVNAVPIAPDIAVAWEHVANSGAAAEPAMASAVALPTQISRDSSGGITSTCGPLVGVPFCRRCDRELGEASAALFTQAALRSSPLDDVTCCGVTTAVRSAPHRYREFSADGASMFVIEQMPDEGTTVAYVDSTWLSRMEAADASGIRDGLCQAGLFLCIGNATFVCEESLSKAELDFVAGVLRDGVMNRFSADAKTPKVPWAARTTQLQGYSQAPLFGSSALNALSRRRDLIPPRFSLKR